MFPPYTGGCIEYFSYFYFFFSVSSLHGRVYRSGKISYRLSRSFLPTREGVSLLYIIRSFVVLFPPYTGGCIGRRCAGCKSPEVSSLHGRVYRHYQFPKEQTWSFLPTREGVSINVKNGRTSSEFPPYTGGCIVSHIEKGQCFSVSSLHGRVYRIQNAREESCRSFLPTREGVSLSNPVLTGYFLFPPYTGGCIGIQ